MYCCNNFSGKYWAVVDPKLYGLPEDSDYRFPDYRGTTVLRVCPGDYDLPYPKSKKKYVQQSV